MNFFIVFNSNILWCFGVAKHLFKGKDGKERCFGKTPHNKTTVIPESVPANTIVNVTVDRCTSHTLYGRLN